MPATTHSNFQKSIMIFLHGYRASGKSTVARLLAETMSCDLIDTDHQIVKRFEGQSIAMIWEKFGEPKFREMEIRVVEDIASQIETLGGSKVISLGGGTVIQPDAFKAIESLKTAYPQRVFRFYLQARPEVLAKRLDGDCQTAQSRPSLTEGKASSASQLKEIKTVLCQRDPIYQSAADWIIDVSDISPQAVAELIYAYIFGKPPVNA